MQRIIFKIRFWILKRLFLESEKYLIIMAINDRMNTLERIALNERWADKENIRQDLNYLNLVKQIFSSKLYS